MRLAARLLAFLAMLCAAGAAHAERRVALIIGNDTYEALPQLRKAAADAGAYAELLRAQGFDAVMLKTNLTRSAMDQAIAVFLDTIQPGDTAVFAYSGHGWSDGVQNYIVGTDAPATGSQEFLARISIPLRNGATGVIDDMDRRGAAVKVAIIDACRDNPFTPATAGRSVGLGRGLVRIDPPKGTFVVFSASPGQTALDRLSDGDADPNSVFTRVFVPLVSQGLSLQEAVKATQSEVVKLARSVDHDQQPAYIDEMLGATCLSGTCTAPGPGPAPEPGGGDAVEIAFWTSIAGSSSAADFEAYLSRYPEGAFAVLAQNRLAALQAPQETPQDQPPQDQPPSEQVQQPDEPQPPGDDTDIATDEDEYMWQEVLADGRAEAYAGYLRSYPDGLHAESARRRLAVLQGEARAEPAEAAGAGGDSYWMHNGSLMRLTASGATRIFAYVTPRASLRDIGVSEGDVVFEGAKSGDVYRGTAWLFSSRCGKTPYEVRGTVDAGQTRVAMRGLAPRLAEDCSVAGERLDELVFTYVSRTRPADAGLADAPAQRSGPAATGQLRVPQTFQIDLDAGAVQRDGADLWFEAETRTALYLSPQNGAALAVGRCGAGTPAGQRLALRDLPAGTTLCVRTSEGRDSEVTIERLTGASPKVLWLSYATR